LDQRTSPSRDPPPSRSLRRCIAAPELPLDELTVPVENRSCGRRTSSPTAAAEPASPLAGSIDPAPSGYPACAPRRPAWGFPPAHRLRLVDSTQQLVSDHWPVLLQVVGDSADGHAIDARATFISLHLLQCLLQVFSLTYFLHQSIRAGWAFGVMRRRERFGLFPFRFAGFTRWQRRKVQFSLDVLPLVAPEIHVLLAAPSRSGLRPSFPAPPICCSTFRIGVPH